MTTDPAVTAAAEAMCDDMLTRPWDRTTPCPAHMRAAEAAVAAARPIIEAEVRERIAAETRAMGHGDYFHGPAWTQEDAAEHCGRCANAEEFAARIARGNA